MALDPSNSSNLEQLALKGLHAYCFRNRLKLNSRLTLFQIIFLITVFCSFVHRVWQFRYSGAWKYERGLSRLMHDDLHWLVIPQRVQYKLAVTLHRCLRHRAPRYLADYCVPVSEAAGRQHLRYARCHQLSVPRVRHSTFGTRAFSVTGPTVWNSLPDHLRDPAVDPEQFNVSALEVLRNRALQIDIYLLTYLFSSGLAVLCFRSL